MRFDIITIFPELITNFPQFGVIKRACNTVNTVDLREFVDKKYKAVDDRPFGGGDGMVFLPDVVDRALSSIEKKNRLYIHSSDSSGG